MREVTQIRVSLYTEETLMRDGAISALSQYSDLRVLPMDHTTDRHVFLAIVHEISESLIRLVERYGKSEPKVRSVLITASSSEDDLHRLKDYEVSNISWREHFSYEDVVQAIRLAQPGNERILSASVDVSTRTDGNSPPQRPATLTEREKAVLRLFADGSDTALVAKRFCCSQRTIKGVSRNIIRKLGASNRTHAVAVGIRTGLL
ncbi:response regulator transcription factor [Streptomyces sp. NPDC058459]|uniref:response regulator transcription factor n=1 Tax=Streptomyces sp. NPDC058459 TaxID=3346508 RepID=UPI00365CADC4